VTADRVEGSELELLPLLPGDDDQLGHRRLEEPLLRWYTLRPRRVKPRSRPTPCPHRENCVFAGSPSPPGACAPSVLMSWIVPPKRMWRNW
jgi:hypothetical protein